ARDVRATVNAVEGADRSLVVARARDHAPGLLDDVRADRGHGLTVTGELGPDDPGGRDERRELADGEGARRLAQPAVGREPELLRPDEAEQRPDPVDDELGRLDGAPLHVDHARAEDLLAAVLGPQLALPHRPPPHPPIDPPPP